MVFGGYSMYYGVAYFHCSSVLSCLCWCLHFPLFFVMVCYLVADCFKFFFCFFTQKPAYEMRISDWSSDWCSSDLVPELEHITLGGEAIPAQLLAQLTKTFPTATISQVYAASEFGSTGSQRDGRAGLAASVLERDETADVQMKVVDGELWVRSRIGMLGYHGDEPIDRDAWRATGDLVEVEGDRILFRGRSSEIINVRSEEHTSELPSLIRNSYDVF